MMITKNERERERERKISFVHILTVFSPLIYLCYFSLWIRNVSNFDFNLSPLSHSHIFSFWVVLDFEKIVIFLAELIFLSTMKKISLKYRSLFQFLHFQSLFVVSLVIRNDLTMTL